MSVDKSNMQCLRTDNDATPIATGTKRKRKAESSFNSKVKDDIHLLCDAEGDLEIFYGTESDDIGIKDCHKLSRHEEFIPINTFSIEHLPEKYRNIQLFSLIKCYSDLVVRLKTAPLNREGENTIQLTSNYWGSGWVSRVGEQFSEQSKKTCPCIECKSCQAPATIWAEIIVCTVKHLVPNTAAAFRTRCDLFYTGGSSDTSFQGTRIKISNGKKDIAEMICVTHDLSLWAKLKDLCVRCDELNANVMQTNYEDNHSLVVIVSHPHGRGKMVSIGEWVSKKSSGDGDVQYQYTTATCRGSSGAPVFILNRDWCPVFSNHPHCGWLDETLNHSAFGPS